ncbi:MAG: hypothetical protein ACKOA8_17435 [Deltaproteobacteria bacterium]
MKSIATIFNEALKFWFGHFGFVLLLQLPLGILVVGQRFLDSYLETHPILAVLLLLPLFSVGSSLSSALTFLYLQTPSPRKLSIFAHLLKDSSQKLKYLVPTSLCVAVFFGLGLAAFILPGLYFISLYFFVPFLVVQEPIQPIANYLFASKSMVTQSRKTFWTTAGLALTTLFMELPLSFLVDYLSNLIGQPAFCDMLISMMFASFLDIMVSVYFLSLSSKGNS